MTQYILAYRRLGLHWKSVLPAHAYMEINYEDIVADQAAASRRLIEFDGLPWEDEVEITDGSSCGFAIPNRAYQG